MKHTTIKYGRGHAQCAEVWRPEKARPASPVLVLIHGGFWRQPFTKRLMHDLAGAVTHHGWIAYNIEYRRIGLGGGGGWPSTFLDVAAAVDAVADVDGADLSTVVTCGHSAGGHLALWAASSRSVGGETRPLRVRVHTAISLAGVVDLVAAAQLNVGGDAVQALMGGEPEAVPDRYRWGSPAACLPLHVPQVLIHGLHDHTVPPALSSAYVERALAAGDPAEFFPVAGAGHREMIDPESQGFQAVLDRLAFITAGLG